MTQNNLHPLVLLFINARISFYFQFLFRLLLVNGEGLVLLFTGKCPGFNCMFISASFMVVFFLTKSENFSTISLFSDWLFSSNRMIPIVSLNFFSQSIPSSGLISFLSVISNCIFCLLFSYSMSTGIFPRNFTSFLFTSWYHCFTL